MERVRENSAQPVLGLAGAVVLLAFAAFVFAGLGNHEAGIAVAIAAIAVVLYAFVSSSAAFVLAFAGFAWYVRTIDVALGNFLGVVFLLIVIFALAGFLTNLYFLRTGKRIAAGLMTQRQREALTGYVFILPWAIGFLAFGLGPMLFSLYASFTKYDIVNAPQWKGWSYNYGYIFQHDTFFPVAVRNTLWYVAFKTPVVIVLALTLALLMNQKVPGVRFFRTIFYMPTVITGVAAIFLWVFVLAPHGILNQGLSLLHIQGPLWFYDPKWTKPGLVVMGLWYLGSPMLVLLAGLNGIPGQLYEAADVEGAGVFRKFWNITLPMLSPTLFFIVLTNIIGAFQVFNSAYVISTSSGVGSTPGDPEQSLLFYEIYLFTKFKNLEMGYACALAWILFVMIMVVTAIQLYLSKRWVYYESG